MTSDEIFEGMLGLVVEGFGSDADDQFFIELSDGSEIEFLVDDLGGLQINYYKGFLDA